MCIILLVLLLFIYAYMHMSDLKNRYSLCDTSLNDSDSN